MATFNKFQSFVEAVAEKKHDLGSDTLTVALCNAANAPSVSADAVLADITVIAYTNLSSRVITTSSSSQTSGTYKLVVADLVLTASGGSVAPFRYVVIYNETAANDELIGYYDYGSDLTLADGESLTLDFSATNGLLQLV
jgi:hypothetical protein